MKRWISVYFDCAIEIDMLNIGGKSKLYGGF